MDTGICRLETEGEVTFPYWLVSALQWLSDTRDPFNSGHGYLWAASAAERAARLENDTERAAALDRIRSVGQRVYTSPDAVDPYSGYNGKAYPGYYQALRSVIKDCLPADAHFPLIYRKNAPHPRPSAARGWQAEQAPWMVVVTTSPFRKHKER